MQRTETHKHTLRGHHITDRRTRSTQRYERRLDRHQTKREAMRLAAEYCQEAR